MQDRLVDVKILVTQNDYIITEVFDYPRADAAFRQEAEGPRFFFCGRYRRSFPLSSVYAADATRGREQRLR